MFFHSKKVFHLNRVKSVYVAAASIHLCKPLYAVRNLADIDSASMQPTETLLLAQDIYLNTTNILTEPPEEPVPEPISCIAARRLCSGDPLCSQILHLLPQLCGLEIGEICIDVIS